MKTTLNLPDYLITEVKIRAANEKRKMKDVIADALERGLGLSADLTSPLEQLQAYHAAGGLDPQSAEKWISDIKEDRETWRDKNS